MKNIELSNFRKQLELSTSNMAIKLGVSKSFYEKVEYMDRNPSYNFILKFKAVFPYADVDKIFLQNSNTERVAV